MKSVAIVGFFGATLPHLQESQAEEIWAANHAMMIMGGREIPRCTRLFELHKESWFRRKELPSHKEYWKWLKEDHGYPIYLQKAIPQITRGVVYPFCEVEQGCFKHLLRRYKDGLEKPDTFLTSSASLMLALAIHERFERVEIYGIGMETETEYAYQLPGFTYLIGLANGRGIDVVNMEESPICKADVYAYTAIPYITLPQLKKLSEVYKRQYDVVSERGKRIIAEHNAGGNKQKEAQAASDLAAAHYGATQMCAILLEQGSQYMSRQALEVKQRKYAHDMELFKADANRQAERFDTLLKAGKQEEARNVWREYLNTRASMHASSGAVQLLQNLTLECDLVKPEHRIVLTIQDA